LNARQLVSFCILEDRRAALIKAFAAAMRDTAFLDDRPKPRLKIAPISGGRSIRPTCCPA
jgi:hypothetical protein